MKLPLQNPRSADSNSTPNGASGLYIVRFCESYGLLVLKPRLQALDRRGAGSTAARPTGRLLATIVQFFSIGPSLSRGAVHRCRFAQVRHCHPPFPGASIIMGIDAHALRFLQYSAKKGTRLGRVATLGRQELHIDEARLRRFLRLRPGYRHEEYAERILLDYLFATCVESFDNSAFEGATHIVDMNRPLPSKHGLYDTVLDAGCLEHIYNAPQALLNISQLCAAGGQILHILPANNFCGHGFWQLSPELFFSLYSERNGYKDTTVFLAALRDDRFWYEVRRPEGGHRAIVRSSSPLYVLCRTTTGSSFLPQPVQQADYALAWSHGRRGAGSTNPKNRLGGAKALARQLLSAPLARPLLDRLSDRSPWKGLCGMNPALVRRRVFALI
jgi:hypothetical protein